MKNSFDEEVIISVNINEVQLIAGGYEDNINDADLKDEIDIVDKTIIKDLLKG